MKSMKHLIVGILVFALYFIIPLILDNFIPSIGDSSNLQLVVRAGVYVLLIVAFIYCYKDSFKKGLKNIKKDRFGFFKDVSLFLVLALLVVVGCSLLVSFAFPGITYTNDKLVETYLNKILIFTLFTTFIYGPIVEEIVFRKTFKDILANKYFYIIFSALVFAFYHVGYNYVGLESIVGMIPYFGAGVVFALSLYKTDNIYVPITVHMLYNVFILYLNF